MSETESKDTPRSDNARHGDDASPQTTGSDAVGQNGQNSGQSAGQGQRPPRDDRRGPRGRNRHRGQPQQNGGQNRLDADGEEEFVQIEGPNKGIVIDLNELKRKPAIQLLAMADTLGIQEGVARARKQDIVFLILKAHARAGGSIFGEGVLEILQDGFGFLRTPDESYLAGPDDIYISPSQIRRFNLRTGDNITGRVRPPKEGERYFALLQVDTINAEPPEASKNKVLFEDLTPLFPRKMFHLERGNGSTEDITGRILDLMAPVGRGQRGMIV
ncbi:MAG: Rho termination factor N-terminal domain-containing protein, partial [Rudaea sp.]